ncbi:ING4 [Mytilus coruscus]|uniref:ING4 n=1 Tax=Mytilus coruscus TaxID=42192 RepID=A0A6J8AAY7_MYTCO|nr:ING4 [Mytilus coruscus]
MCYKPPTTAPVINASTPNKETYKYSVCKVDIDEGMISCDNKKCNKGKWFHFSCMGMTEQEAEDLEDEGRMWFCCEGCRGITPNIFLCAHLLITDVSRGVSERLGHQLVWNRTVNFKADNNTNIEMDLQMEFFNRKFKESIKDAGGNVTDTTKARHSKMLWTSNQTLVAFN